MSFQLQKSAKKSMLPIWGVDYHQDQIPDTRRESLTTNSGWDTQKKPLWMVPSKTNTLISLSTKRKHFNSTWITPLTDTSIRKSVWRSWTILMYFQLPQPQSSHHHAIALYRLIQVATAYRDSSRCMEISYRSKMISSQRVWVLASLWVLLTYFSTKSMLTPCWEEQR